MHVREYACICVHLPIYMRTYSHLWNVSLYIVCTLLDAIFSWPMRYIYYNVLQESFILKDSTNRKHTNAPIWHHYYHPISITYTLLRSLPFKLNWLFQNRLLAWLYDSVNCSSTFVEMLFNIVYLLEASIIDIVISGGHSFVFKPVV